MVESRHLQEIDDAASAAAPFVRTAEDHAPHSHVHQRAGAHRARLFRNVKIAFVKPPIADRRLGLCDRQHLGMCGRILQQLNLVVCLRDHAAAPHDHCADRHFFRFEGLLRLPERFAHKCLVGCSIEHHAPIIPLARVPTISFTSRTSVRTLPAVRVFVTCCCLVIGFGSVAHAQEQERKLIDRLLKPDMALQNSIEQKQFTVRGTTTTKQAHTKAFYVPERRPEKSFFGRMFGTKAFDTKRSRYQDAQANLSTRTQIAKADVPYQTAAYRDLATARDASKTAEVSEFSGSRPFLIQGKSQKALSQQDRPLTIDEVRELLNKNK